MASSSSDTAQKPCAAIGIDLGTTFSCVSVMDNGRPIAIQNDHGKYTTPSIVAFDENDQILTGLTAQDAATPPAVLVYDSKRLIGRQFRDATVQSDMKTWPFKICDVNGKPHYEIKVGDGTKYVEPEFVSAEILKTMRKTAETYLKNQQVVKGAVITIPAYFDNRQREATMHAARMAGIRVLRMVSEPVAAAVAYTIQQRPTKKQTVLVYDLGGGTFDVTIAEMEEGKLTVKAISGNAHLGGQDFDRILLKHVAEKFKDDKNIDIFEENKKKQLKRVNAKIIQAKESLSFRPETSVHVETIQGDIDLHIKLTRNDINTLCGDLFRGTMQVVDDALNMASATTDTIDQVILVGGSTRIPMVEQLLIEKFGEQKIRKSINPDEAVAQGAAILAHGFIDAGGGIKINDVLPFTIGMAYRGMLIGEAFRRGTKYPCEATIFSETAFDNQTSVSQGIYQGERANCQHNVKLGQVTLNGLKRVPKGNRLETKFVIDENGILSVTLTELASKKSSSIQISYDSEAVSNADVANHSTQQAIYRREDEEFRQRVLERNRIEDEVHKIQQQAKGLFNRTEISAAIHEDMLRRIRDFLDWTDSLPELRDLRPRFSKLKQELSQTLPKNTNNATIPSPNLNQLVNMLRL